MHLFMFILTSWSVWHELLTKKNIWVSILIRARNSHKIINFAIKSWRVELNQAQFSYMSRRPEMLLPRQETVSTTLYKLKYSSRQNVTRTTNMLDKLRPCQHESHSCWQTTKTQNKSTVKYWGLNTLILWHILVFWGQ